MSPQHRTPGANAETAATPAEESGRSAPPSAPDNEAAATPPGAEAAPEAPEAKTAAPAPAPAPDKNAAPEAPAAPTTTEGTKAPGERVAVAAAAGAAPPGVKSATGVDRGRPRKPVLAGAAIAGAALIAIPLLLAGSARDDGPPDNDKELSAGDTVLNPGSGPADLYDYKAKKPSSSPSEKKPKKAEKPKAAAPKAVVSAPQPSPSKSPEKKESKPKPEPKPKAAPKPDWSTETVTAPSVLEVKQAWTTNRIRMVMQTDGNLVVYNEKGKPIWAAMTFGENHRAIFQPDGNLVIHNGDDRPIWASKSHGHEGARLVLRADGKVVIVHNGRVIWST
ncbi:mannose-binding protein [Streptomyces sp. NPDC055099]